MEWTDALLGGFQTRIFRISFSGELSFEISVEASVGLDFWNALLDAALTMVSCPMEQRHCM